MMNKIEAICDFRLHRHMTTSYISINLVKSLTISLQSITNAITKHRHYCISLYNQVFGKYIYSVT